jgi:hypothetical protein
MKAELCKPNVRHRFFIFRIRVTIEQIMKDKNKVNISEGQRVDPLT